jgi:hypothetical protein
VGVDTDRLSYPLHHPSTCECHPRAQSSWFKIVLPFLVAKPFLRESLHPWAHRLWLLGWGPEPLDKPDSHRLFLGVAVPWGDLPCPGGEGLSPCQKGLPCYGGDHAGCMLRGKGPKPGLERTGVRCSRTFSLRASDVGGHVLSGGTPVVTTSSWHSEDPRASCEMVRS